MASKLPQSLEMQAPNGTAPSGRALDFSSLDAALQNAGQQIARVDEARKTANDKIAGRMLEETHQVYTAGAIERSAAYDGRTPGLAQAELAAYDATIAPLLAREDLDDGVRDSLTRRARDLRVKVAGQAINVEATVTAQRSAADRDASEQADAVRAGMAFNDLLDGLTTARLKDWDGQSPQMDAAMGDFNLAREQVLAELPEPIAVRLRPMLDSRQATLQAGLLVQDREARDAATLNTVVQGVAALENRAARDPAVMGRWDEEFGPLRGLVPSHMLTKTEQEAKRRVFARGLEGRIHAGEWGAVEAEIANGAYDWMDPEQIEGLQREIRTAETQGVISDAQTVAQLGIDLDADLAGVLAGNAPNTDLVRQARLVGGDDLAFKVETDQQAAALVRPLLAGLRSMTPAAAAAEVARMQAAADTPVKLRAAELATEMVNEDLALRGDPGLWASTPLGVGDRVAQTVQARQAAFLETPSQATAVAFASATWTAQQEAGLAMTDRRILPRSLARGWVAELNEPGETGAALRTLAARTALFGGFQPQIIEELSRAGLRSPDVGAMTFYAQAPSQMNAYVRSRGRKLEEMVNDKDDRDLLDAAVRREMASWERALGTGRGTPAANEAARVVAYDAFANGTPIDEAARQATAPMTDGWSFEGTWAIPTGRGVPEDRVRGNARLAVVDLIGGRYRGGLATPPSSRMTPEQSQRTYRDVVRETGVWRNLSDGSGVELVTPRADNSGWVRVQDAAGQPVVLTWQQLASYRPD